MKYLQLNAQILRKIIKHLFNNIRQMTECSKWQPNKATFLRLNIANIYGLVNIFEVGTYSHMSQFFIFFARPYI